MYKLQNLSSKELIIIIKKQGYVFLRQKGSHLVFKNHLENKILVVPNHKILKIGTTLQILKTIGLNKEDLEKL